ncbi:MAG: zinc finger domain-containing protein [Thermoplasmatota archaeon]
MIIMKEDYTCTSCGITLVGLKNTVFPCPECGEAMIGRCKKCRDQAEKYECPECGFRGP